MLFQRFLAVACVSTLVVSCGDDDAIGCSDSSDDDAVFSLGISDAPVDDLKAVVIDIDRVILTRAGKDVVIDRFTIEDDSISVQDAESVQINLLDYRGKEQLFLIRHLAVPDGSYSDLRFRINDDSISQSYVITNEDTQH